MIVTASPNKVRRHFTFDAALYQDMDELAQRKGSSISVQFERAAREHLRRQKAMEDDSILAPVISQLIDEKFAQLDTWLRSGVWGGATYSATATLLLLELLCGQTVEPSEAKKHLDLIRGRAWKMVRKEQPEPAASE